MEPFTPRSPSSDPWLLPSHCCCLCEMRWGASTSSSWPSASVTQNLTLRLVLIGPVGHQPLREGWGPWLPAGGHPCQRHEPSAPGLELQWLGRLELFERPFLLARLLGRRTIPSLWREGLGRGFSFKTGRSPLSAALPADTQWLATSSTAQKW